VHIDLHVLLLQVRVTERDRLYSYLYRGERPSCARGDEYPLHEGFFTYLTLVGKCPLLDSGSGAGDRHELNHHLNGSSKKQLRSKAVGKRHISRVSDALMSFCDILLGYWIPLVGQGVELS
jgi:hypothetical protein